MLTIDADAVAARVDPLHLVEALRAGHAAGSLGTVERLLLDGPDGGGAAALTWAAWAPERGLAVKTATVFPQNARAGRPVVQSVVILFDGATGTPVAAIYGESFTRLKTAADSALAVDLLARPDVATLAVLGAGGQAETHVRMLRAVRPSIRRVLVWNRSPDAAHRLAATLAASGLDSVAVPEPESAVRAAQLVSCLTASRTPVLHGDWLCPGAHVDLVGAFTPAMRESDDQVVLRGRLFADSHRFGVMACGDYAVPIAAGLIPRAAILGDLFDLCASSIAGRRSPEDITVFKNGGGGHLDAMAAAAFLAAARAEAAAGPNSSAVDSF